MNSNPPHPRSSPSEAALRVVLRYVGTVSLLAAIAVFMPYDWMDRIHQWIGLGPLPDAPIVGYLARTLSAFYALLGGLLWVVSFDLHRQRPVLLFLGIGFLIFGVTALWVDLHEGMPWLWRFSEGPIVIVFGTVILWLSLRLQTLSK